MEQESNEDLHERWVALGRAFYEAMYAVEGSAILGPDTDTPEQQAFAAWMIVDDELWRRGFWKDRPTPRAP